MCCVLMAFTYIFIGMKNNTAIAPMQYIYFLEVAERLYSWEISELIAVNFLPHRISVYLDTYL